MPRLACSSAAHGVARCQCCSVACLRLQVSLPTQYNGKNQEPVGALSSTLARLQVWPRACLCI